jgi:phage/plasmid-like protein (TIGR03299 family)
MAHEIGEMFWHGEVPWHGLGRELPQPATLEEALCAGGLDWQVELVALQTADGAESHVRQRRAVVRMDLPKDDPRRVLGAVHPNFRLLQNREGAEMFHRLLDLGERRYHTGGYLRNGEVVWLLARLPATIVVNDDDPVETYVLYSNSHDGSQAIDLRLTTVRVVCRNTLSLALGSDSTHAFRRAHRSSSRVIEQEAKKFFEAIRQHIEETQGLFRRLASKRCDDDAFRDFVRALLPDPQAPVNADKKSPQANAHARRLAMLADCRKAVTRIRNEGLAERDLGPDAPTWWGAVNAVTGWVDHVQSVTGARYAHAVFGAGDRIKRTAVEVARAAIALR